MPSLPDPGPIPPGLPELLHGEVLLRHLQVSVADDQGAILYVNERMCEACGYRPDELLQHNYSVLATGRHPPEFFRDLWDTIGAGQIWRGRIVNKAKDGRLFETLASIVPFVDAAGARRYM